MLTMIFNAGLAILAVLVVVWVVNRNSAKSLFNWGRANVGEAIRGVTETNPIALLNQAVEDAAKEIEAGRKGVASIGGMLRGLKEQIAGLVTDEQRLLSRIKAAKANGDQNNTLIGYAEQLASTREQLEANRRQENEMQTQYDLYAKQISASQQLISDAQRKAETLKARLQMSEAAKSASSFAAGFDPGKTNSKLAEAANRVQKIIHENEAAADVNSIGTQQRIGELKDAEAERKQRALDILAELDEKPDNTPVPA